MDAVVYVCDPRGRRHRISSVRVSVGGADRLDLGRGELVVKLYHKERVSSDAVRGFVECPSADAGDRKRFREWVNHLHRVAEPSRTALFDLGSHLLHVFAPETPLPPDEEPLRVSCAYEAKQSAATRRRRHITAGASAVAGTGTASAAGPDLRRCAAVWLVMKGDAYIPGALVSCWSWKNTGSRARTVCMVTADVSEGGRQSLREVFDEVVEVPYLRQECRMLSTQRKRAMYDDWVGEGFTKWACLSLTRFDKVLLVDADTVVLGCMDALFSIPCPAGTFSSPWHRPWNPRPETKPNPYMGLRHGDAIPRETLEQGYHTSVLIGTTVLLQPSAKDYEDLRAWLAARRPFGFKQCGSMMDEQCIAFFYHEVRPRRSWHYIHQRYNFIPWKPQWLDGGLSGAHAPRIFHYFNKKPWDISRREFQDCEAWWLQADHLCTTKSALKRWFRASELFQGPQEARCFWCNENRLSTAAQAHRVFDPASGATQCPALRQEPSREGGGGGGGDCGGGAQAGAEDGADGDAPPRKQRRREGPGVAAPLSAPRLRPDKTAFVTWVMCGDDYVKGALTLGHSLREQGSRAARVCLATPDVSEAARRGLATVFDRVVSVPYIETTAVRAHSKRFADVDTWLGRAFTKFHALALDAYEAIALLDADMLCVAPPDAVFEVPAPAGICSTLPLHEQAAWHRRRLGRARVEDAIEREYGIRGCAMVLRPDRSQLATLRGQVQQSATVGRSDLRIGPDELLLSHTFRDEWVHLHARFGCHAWKARELPADQSAVFLHYVSNQPWKPRRQLYPDMKLWHDAAKRLLSARPDLAPLFGQSLR